MYAKILWVCLISLIVTSAKEIAKFDASSVDIIHGELELRRHLESWIGNVEKNGLDSVCYDNDENAISNINSNETNTKDIETCQKCSFSGEIINGLPHGKGTLKFNNNQKKNTCLKKQFEFFKNRNVVQIKGRFDNGVPNGRVNVKFSDGLKAKFLVMNGLAHGFFKADLAAKWSVGSFVNGTVTGECWIVEQETILYGHCTDAFRLDNSANTVVIHRSKVAYDKNRYPTRHSVAICGKIQYDNNEDVMLNDATDCELMSLSGSTRCARSVGRVRLMGPRFKYSLENRERKFKEYDHISNCTGDIYQGRDESSKSLRDYIKQLSMERALGMTPDKSTLNIKESTKLIQNVKRIKENKYEGTLTVFSETKITFRHQGDLDKNGKFDGYTVLNIINDCDDVIVNINKNINDTMNACPYPTFTRIAGFFKGGLLDGPVYMFTKDNQRQSWATVGVSGSIHGLLVVFGNPVKYPTKGHDKPVKYTGTLNHHYGIGLLARFVNGKPEDKIYLGMIGDVYTYSGLIYGYPTKNNNNNNKDNSLTISGDSTAYLYPWYDTALVGKFNENIMISTKHSWPVKTECNGNFIRIVDFEHSDKNDFEYSYDPPTTKRASSNPMKRDPYEELNVEVHPSSIPGAGDGLFAKRDIKKGQLVALYGGLFYGPEDEEERKVMCEEAKDTISPCDRFSIDTHMGGIYYLPPPVDDWYWSHKSTSAWKANNAFGEDAQMYFHDVEHPRFGLMPSLTAFRDVSAGEELYVDYGYALEDEGKEIAKNHEWWYQARREHLEKIKNKAKAAMEEELKGLEVGELKKEGLISGDIKSEL